jgi:ketopantoate reductase
VEGAAQLIRPCVGPDTVILPVQNGVDIAERIGRILGQDRVLGGSAWIGGQIESPGVVVHRIPGGSTGGAASGSRSCAPTWNASAVGRACGVPIADGYVDKRLAALQAMPSFRASTAVDLLAGRPLETEALNGTVVRLGTECGVPTPLNFAMYACLRPFIDGAPAAA